MASVIPPQTVRSRLMLKIAEELVGMEEVEARHVDLAFRVRGASRPSFTFASDDSPGGIGAVVRGEATLGVLNPSTLATLAVGGIPPFRGEQPIRTIAVLPSPDRLVVAVRPETGIERLEDVAERRVGIRFSARGQRDNAIHLVTDHVLEASGWSLGDLLHWGGSIHYEEGLPTKGRRLAMAAADEVDLVIDEGSSTWVTDACKAGLRILDLSPTALERLGSWGYRPGPLRESRFPLLGRDVATIDYSGFALYVHADCDDELVGAICAALDRRSGEILLQTAEPVSIEEMVSGGESAPIGAPLHPAAAAFWRAAGYLKSPA